MRVSTNDSFQWLRYQNAPYFAYESESAAPENVRKYLHKYVFGEKAGDKKGTIEFRYYVDFDAIFLGCVFERGQYGANIIYTFKDADDGQLYKVSTPLDGKCRGMLFRLASIAKDNKVFSVSFKAVVTNGVATFGKYIDVKGENGRPTIPIHQGTFYNGVGFVKNEAVMESVRIIWDRCCDFHFNPSGDQNGADFQKTLVAKSEFFSAGERVHTWFSSKEKQNDFWAIFDKSLDSYIETKVCPLLNAYFAQNIEFQAALPTAIAETAETAEVIAPVIEAAPKNIVEQVYGGTNQPPIALVASFENLDDSGDSLPF